MVGKHLFLCRARCDNVACCSRCLQQKKKDITFVNMKGQSRWESELNVDNEVKSYPIAIKSQKHILSPGLKGVLHNQLQHKQKHQKHELLVRFFNTIVFSINSKLKGL